MQKVASKRGVQITRQAMRILDILQEKEVLLNGDDKYRLAGNLNVCYQGIYGKAITNLISDRITIFSDSVCIAQSVKPSHVIMALRYEEKRAYSSIQIGLGRYTDETCSEFGAWRILDGAKKLRKINS